MAKAIWNGVVLAESDTTQHVEGNHYFPPDSIKREYFTETPTRTNCPWKGVASYFTIEVNGQANKDAAWAYKTPLQGASHLKDHVAFWKGIKVEA